MTSVLHVIETLGRGGAERQLLQIVPELQRQGVPSTVLALRPPYDLAQDFEEAGVAVWTPTPHRKWDLLRGARSIARTAQAVGAGVIHAHLYFPAVYTALARATGQTRARTVVTFHNQAYAPGVNRPGLGLAARRHLARWLYPRGIDLTLGVSRAVADHYSKALGLGTVAVSPNAVAVPRPKVGNPQGKTVRICLPGRLVREKGHDILLHAAARLGSEGLPLELVFAGGGPLASELGALAHALDLTPVVTGALDHRALIEEIAKSDLVVLPSRSEGFGMVAVEALALGKPVIAARTGGLPEVLGECAVLVAPENPIALAQAITALWGDPHRRRALSALGPARAARFAPAPIAADLRGRYAELIQGAMA